MRKQNKGKVIEDNKERLWNEKNSTVCCVRERENGAQALMSGKHGGAAVSISQSEVVLADNKVHATNRTLPALSVPN